MITTCTGCQTRYRLEDAKVPRRRIRVRCPRCTTVFALDGTLAGTPAEASADHLVIERSTGDFFGAPGRTGPPAGGAGRQVSAPAIFSRESGSSLGPAAKAEPAAIPLPDRSAQREVEVPAARQAPAGARPAPDMDAAPAGAAAPPPPEAMAAQPAAPAAAAATVAPTLEVEVAGDIAQKPRRDRDKARRLARALVSDILVYNREARDRALSEGNLIQALGPEIKKSWELYKERVTPEVANSTSHFRDALNEILAEGQKVF